MQKSNALKLIITLAILATALPGFKQPGDEKNPGPKDSLNVLAPSGINLRENAELKAKVMTLIPYAAKVRVIERTGKKLSIEGYQGEWFFVEYDGKRGYTFSGFLSKLNPPKISGEEIPLKKYADMYYKKTGQKKSCLTPKTKDMPESYCTTQEYEGGITLRESGAITGSGEYLSIPGVTLQECYLLNILLMGNKWEFSPGTAFPRKNATFKKGDTEVVIGVEPGLVDVNFGNCSLGVYKEDDGRIRLSNGCAD